MRLFQRKEAKASAKTNARAKAATDFRSDSRRNVWGELDLYEAVIEGSRVRVRDLSDGGLSLAICEMTAPDRGVLELSRNGHVVKTAYVVRCWGRGDTVGYKLAQELTVARSSTEAEAAELRARSISRRIAAEVERFRPSSTPATPKTPADGAMGGLRGDALRARLNL